MVVLTITSTSNLCTVYFDRPIAKANYVSLLTCSLPNSWHNLKKQGQIILKQDQNVLFTLKFSPGHYSAENLQKNYLISLKKLL